MFRKKNRSKKRSRAMLSAYSIIMVLIILLGILSHALPKAEFVAAPPEEEEESEEVGPGEWEGEVPAEGSTESEEAATDGEKIELPDGESVEPTVGAETKSQDEAVASEEVTAEAKTVGTEVVATEEEETETETFASKEECEEVYGEDGCVVKDGSGVVGAELYQVLMAPILGFADAIDVCIFIMMLGGLLAVVARTKALETGIKILVAKLHGKEYILILLLMFIFSILGTTYGFLEESVGFYVLIAATMFAAGLDPLVGVATILLGAGSGVLGSTINPFATGVALSAMKDAGIEYNQGTIILIAVILWLTTLAISAFFVVKYAKKVQKDKGSTFLSLREQAAAEKTYGKFLKAQGEVDKLSIKQILTLVVFAITFLVMIVGFIPWGDFDIDFFDSWTGWLTGAPLGSWWFYEAALWFLICAIIIAIINRQGEHGFVDAFVDGADDMIGVILVIAVARGASVLMAETALDNYIIYNASNFLATLPEMAFVPLNYLLHVVLSVLVPSSSGLATLSTPIITPVAANLGYSTDVAAMTIVAANGLVNLVTPTCGAIMGGLALAKVDYSTWFKWGIRVVACIAIVNIIVLCLFSL
ncbi:YfcC family protein [Candidatus Saccharibacteria bacterium]|nr:YfcC family protein [Candidatus Saccharibacteria bacterium]